MIPNGGIQSLLQTQKPVTQPSKTYRFDMKTGRILGKVDGLEAVKQAVYKILETNRYEHIIYKSNYGNEIAEVLGFEASFFKTEFSKALQNALLQDDRISAIEDIQMTTIGDEATVQFTVVSTYGSFEITRQV